jgi:hypothetical protein
VAVIQDHAIKRDELTILRQLFHGKHDENVVATWRLDLDKIRRIFEVGSCTSA